MILINLLPHREAARKLRRDMFNLSMGAAFLVGGLVAGAIFLWYESQIIEQQMRNLLLKTEITKLEKQIKDIAGLESEIAVLGGDAAAAAWSLHMPVHAQKLLVDRAAPRRLFQAAEL